MFKIACYFTHCETLGHTTRIFSLAKRLKEIKPNTEFLFLQGGKELAQKQWEIDNSNIINLPNPFYSKNVFKGEKCRSTIEETKKRIETMHEALIKFEPDIFITEYFPFGREDCVNELVPIVKWLNHKGIKIYASIGYPVISTKIEKIEQIMGMFEKIIIHSPQEMDFRYLLDYLETQDMKGTAKQLLYFKTPSVLVPREKENNKFYLEQKYRAYMLEKMGFGTTISYENSTAESMAEALKEALQKKPKQLPEKYFNGAEETAKVIGL